MPWVYFLVASNFLSALTVLLDKFLLTSRRIGQPVVYAFYIGFLSITAVAVLPLGVVLKPTNQIIFLSLAVAVAYLAFILFFYKAIKAFDASDVAPVSGATAALSAVFFSWLILDSPPPANFIPGLILLVSGMLFLAHSRFSKRAVFWTVTAGFSFGLSSILVKQMFNVTPFLNAFFWSRMANVVGALMLLCWPGNWQAVTASLKKSSFNTKLLVVFNKTLGGVAFLLFLLAVKWGEITLVNALGGIQFAFLLGFAFIFTKKFPEYFSESIHKKSEIIHKTMAVAAIVTGFFILFR